VFYSGGKLAADLTLPKLAARWAPDSNASARAPDGRSGRGSRASHGSGGLSEAQRAGLWEQAIGAARQATAAVGAHRDDPAGVADAAWAASDFLASAARLVGGRRGGPLSAAAEDYDRAARQAWGRLPDPAAAGAGLRAASGLLAAARTVRSPENAQLLALLAQLAVLAEAVGRMRTEQDRAVQPAPRGEPPSRSAPSAPAGPVGRSRRRSGDGVLRPPRGVEAPDGGWPARRCRRAVRVERGFRCLPPRSLRASAIAPVGGRSGRTRFALARRGDSEGETAVGGRDGRGASRDGRVRAARNREQQER